MKRSILFTLVATVFAANSAFAAAASASASASKAGSASASASASKAGSASASAATSAGADLFKSKNCIACHAVGNKIVGPAFKDVASKYAGQKDAEDKLAKKVIAGGKGVWGEIPMPANTQVSEAEAHTLVKWVLSQK